MMSAAACAAPPSLLSGLRASLALRKHCYSAGGACFDAAATAAACSTKCDDPGKEPDDPSSDVCAFTAATSAHRTRSGCDRTPAGFLWHEDENATHAHFRGARAAHTSHRSPRADYDRTSAGVQWREYKNAAHAHMRAARNAPRRGRSFASLASEQHRTATVSMAQGRAKLQDQHGHHRGGSSRLDVIYPDAPGSADAPTAMGDGAMVAEPLPPYDDSNLAERKVRLDEDAWNARDPARVAALYAADARVRTPEGEFLAGRAAIMDDLERKWHSELDYRLVKQLWCSAGSKISVVYQYEYRVPGGRVPIMSADGSISEGASVPLPDVWWRAHGTELYGTSAVPAFS